MTEFRGRVESNPPVRHVCYPKDPMWNRVNNITQRNPKRFLVKLKPYSKIHKILTLEQLDNNNNSLIATSNQNTVIICLGTTQVQSYE